MKHSTEIRTLKRFAFEKEIKQRELAKTTTQEISNSAYQLALRHLKLLEKDGLIYLKKEDDSKRGKPAKVYAITFLGLVVVLSECEDTYEKIDLMAQTHSDLLPLIFGKWQYFEMQNIKHLVIDQLKRVSKMFASDLLWVTKIQAYEDLERQEQQKKEKRSEHEQKMRKIFKEFYGAEDKEKFEQLQRAKEYFDKAFKEIPDPRREFLDLVFAIAPARGYAVDRETVMQFFQVLKGDVEIKAYITEELKKLSKEYAAYLKNIEEWREWWKK